MLKEFIVLFTVTYWVFDWCLCHSFIPTIVWDEETNWLHKIDIRRSRTGFSLVSPSHETISCFPIPSTFHPNPINLFNAALMAVHRWSRQKTAIQYYWKWDDATHNTFTTSNQPSTLNVPVCQEVNLPFDNCSLMSRIWCKSIWLLAEWIGCGCA